VVIFMCRVLGGCIGRNGGKTGAIKPVIIQKWVG
jgi:hypothetical protein